MRSGVSPESTSTSPSKPRERLARRSAPHRRCRAASPARRPRRRSSNASRVVGRGDDDDAARRPHRGRAVERPSRPCGGRAARGSASARRSASACRARRPSRRLRAAGHVTELNGWGARIRTWDRGTKTRCLTAWLRPTGAEAALGTPTRGAREEEDQARRSRAIAITAIATALTTRKRDRHAEHEQLRGGEDPGEPAARRPSVLVRPAYHQKPIAITASATAAHQCSTWKR